MVVTTLVQGVDDDASPEATDTQTIDISSWSDPGDAQSTDMTRRRFSLEYPNMQFGESIAIRIAFVYHAIVRVQAIYEYQDDVYL